MADGALSGLRVVELGDFISAAYCTKLLADLGAEVIKVEKPGYGDSARRQGPFPDDIPHPDKSGLFIYLNSNKLGVTLDVGRPTGQALFKDLIEDADLVVENNQPEVMRRLALDYNSLRSINARLIVSSITPFGNCGPYSGYKGYAINSVASSGIAYRTGEPERHPLTTPFCQADFQAGLHTAAASMAALLGRRLTRRGQHVDVSAVDCLANIVGGTQVVSFVYLEALPVRAGHRVNLYYPWTVLPCKDGYMEIISMQDRQWDSFIDLIGNPEWAKDLRFQNKIEMVQYADEVDSLLAPWLTSHTKQEIWEASRERRLPYQPVRNVAELLDSEHLKARDFFVEVEVPGSGKVMMPGAPYELSGTPWQIRRPAPRLGQHNAQIFCERLGLSRQELVNLAQVGIV